MHTLTSRNTVSDDRTKKVNGDVPELLTSDMFNKCLSCFQLFYIDFVT